jgi:hypothetical protein
VPADSQFFAIRYGVFRFLLAILGCGPRFSGVSVTADRLRVRMGWAFRADIPRSSVTAVAEDRGWVGGIGVHGWRGRWLVNGAATGLVAVHVAPPAPARVCFVRVHLRRLRVSVDDPAGLVASLGP